jgi:hypothetical protein
MNVADFKNLIRALSPNDRSKIITKHLTNKVIFHKKHCYFLKMINLTYEKHKSYEEDLLPIITGLLNDSFKALSDSDRQDIMELKEYRKIFENSAVKTYMPQLKADLTNESLQFDTYTSEVHFNNGYFDIQKDEFCQRKLGKHFITSCISYDYKEPKQKSIDYILDKLSKTYPSMVALDAILSIIGSALTGLAIRDSYILFFIGDGSAGKSTIMDLTKYTVECYLKQIKPDMFVEGKNTDKIVNTYDTSKFIRITWLNEPKDRKFDATFFKSWADGECNAEKLYAEGSHDFKHYSLTFLTANNMPNITVGGGTARRLRACPHDSKFVDNEKDVNEEKYIYLKDKNFKPKVEHSTELKNAFFKILVSRAHKWLKTKKIELPESFKELTQNILNSNDHIQDFIDGVLVKTDNENDRIGKQDMLKYYSAMYPNKHLQSLQLQMLLKERGIKYNRQFRSGGVQGCFHGVKLKSDEDEDCDENDDYNNGIDKTNQSIDISHLLKKENDELKKQIEQLKAQLESMQKKTKRHNNDNDDNSICDNITASFFSKPKKALKEESDAEDEKPKKIQKDKKPKTPTNEFSDIVNEMLELI